MQQFAQRVGQRGHRPPDVPFRKRIADAVGNGAQFQERHSALQAGIKERRAFHILDLHPDAIEKKKMDFVYARMQEDFAYYRSFGLSKEEILHIFGNME